MACFHSSVLNNVNWWWWCQGLFKQKALFNRSSRKPEFKFLTFAGCCLNIENIHGCLIYRIHFHAVPQRTALLVKAKGKSMLKKTRTISLLGKLLVSWAILMHIEVDSWFLFQFCSLYCSEFTEFSFWTLWRFLHFMLTTIVLVRFICKNLVTFGRAEFARHVGDVSVLHSPLSVLFYLTNMPSPSCVFHVRHRLYSPCYSLHPCWAWSSRISPCSGS